MGKGAGPWWGYIKKSCISQRCKKGKEMEKKILENRKALETFKTDRDFSDLVAEVQKKNKKKG